MITALLELVQKLVQEYKKHGLAYLINSPLLPEFHQLVEHLSGITPKIVGITDENYKDFFKKDTTTYFNIVEEQEFCIGVFCLSAGSSLNLHDHPNMLVLSKFLMGSVYHRSLDLVDSSQQVELPKRLIQDELTDVVGKKLEAVVRAEKVLKAGDINYLTPDRGNIHKFTALENTAILDILLPNYNETDHYCNYYIEVPLSGDNETWAVDVDLDQEQEKTEEMKIYENHVNKREGYSESMVSCIKGQKLKQPGESTTLIYILPPLDQPISLIPYSGENFEYNPLS